MANFAELDNQNVVVRVLALNNETIGNLLYPESNPIGVAFLQHLYGGDSRWEQTSYNASFRKNYAGIGFTFDVDRDAFIPIKPFPSWELDEETCQWVSPVPMPNDGFYYWDEETISWKKAEE